MSDDQKRVTVPTRVHPDTRDEWHDYVEESDEWNSVSELIRNAVYREIDGWYSPHQQGALDTTELEKSIGELKTDIKDIKARLDTNEKQTDAEERELIEVIREHIPTVESPQDILFEIEKFDSAKMKEAGIISILDSYIASKVWVNRSRVNSLMYNMEKELSSIIIVEGPDGADRICEVKDGL